MPSALMASVLQQGCHGFTRFTLTGDVQGETACLKSVSNMLIVCLSYPVIGVNWAILIGRCKGFAYI